MIIKDAFRSLINSFSKAFFYWLTFVLTSMFIFLFFNISMSDTVGVHWINNDNGIATTYRNEFEVGREALSQMADVGSIEEFSSVTGWV